MEKQTTLDLYVSTLYVYNFSRDKHRNLKHDPKKAYYTALGII